MQKHEINCIFYTLVFKNQNIFNIYIYIFNLTVNTVSVELVLLLYFHPHGSSVEVLRSPREGHCRDAYSSDRSSAAAVQQPKNKKHATPAHVTVTVTRPRFLVMNSEFLRLLMLFSDRETQRWQSGTASLPCSQGKRR